MTQVATSVVVGLFLTVLLVTREGVFRWRDRRCRQRGHRWVWTPTGNFCPVCKRQGGGGDLR